MYRVMIIDDEKAVRSIIKKLTDWDALHAVVAGEAESGIEAINIIDDVQPDVALVDIRMPFMDGITFIEYIRTIYPDLKIIVISAYQDFEYARKCIELGVSRYLLKPISRKELAEALSDTLGKIEEKRGEENVEEHRISVNTYISFIKENYSDPQINLTYMARKFGFNSAYFSRKFKERTGQNFVDYLTAYRMEMACELAREGKKMYQAAEEVGIPDAGYFGKCFKKHKNMPYTEYAKLAAEQADRNEKTEN